MIQEQHFEELPADEIYGTVEKMHAEGYRMVQICGVTMEGASRLIYSFDKDMELRNLETVVPFGTPVKSITPIYWAAFIYENEVHDLFDVEFTDSRLDYKGNFFKLSTKNPWKGPDAKGAERWGREPSCRTARSTPPSPSRSTWTWSSRTRRSSASPPPSDTSTAAWRS